MKKHKIKNSFPKIFILILLLISVIIKVKAANHPVQIEVETQNLPAYHRMKVHFTDSIIRQASLIRPTLVQDTAAGRIEVIFNLVNIEEDKKQIIHDSTAQYPLRIITSYPAPKTLKLVVATQPFNYLTQHYSFRNKQYYFEIYYPESYATPVRKREKVPEIVPKEKPQEKIIPQTATQADPIPEQLSEKESRLNWRNTLSRAIQTALFIVLMLFILAGAALLIIYIYSGRNILKPYLDNLKKSAKQVKTPPSTVKNGKLTASEPDQPQDQSKKIENIESTDDKVDKKRSEIQKIMKKKGLTYEEAALYYNVNKGKFNAK